MVMVVAVAEKAAATAFANVVLGRLVKELENKYQMWKSIETEVSSLQEDLSILAAAVDDYQICSAASRTAVARVYSEQISELTHDIEDCIERFLHPITSMAGASRVRRYAHRVWMSPGRLEFAAKIKKFRSRVAEARQRALDAASVSADTGGAQHSNEQGYAHVCDPVGIAEATKEVRALLCVEPNQDGAEGTSNTPAASQARLRVVALVGFGGSGKTILAREVYNTVSTEGALRCAWIDGHKLDHKDANGIVKHVQDELQLGEERQDKQNRYLIVIDDIKEKHTVHWDTLMNSFRNNGRIIVTTTNRSVANKCCNNPRKEDRYTFGRLYNMRSLGEKDSRKIALEKDSPELVLGSTKLLKKCGGLPLALYSVACQLRSKREPTGKLCKQLCSDLGTYLEREDYEPNFARLRGVLAENYTSLSDYTVRTCLLYLGIFPLGHPLKKNFIIRRWLAEGYARHHKGRHQSAADKNFETLMDRSIILPAGPVSSSIEKTCKTHGIMHAFMLHKSASQNFIMPFGTHNKKVRHLFIHDNNWGSSEIKPEIDLSLVRSLTVMGNAGGAISNFNKYELTRVLDLAGCIDLKDCHLKYICKLWNLRYLSLGPDIREIPKKIAQLKLLETLVVSKTRVYVLPVEAIGPCLTHLLGKFKLQDPVKTDKLPKECILETVAGFVANKGQGFLQLMDCMKKLNKVKIWCECEETEQDQVDMNKHLSEAIQKYIKTPVDLDEDNDRSLSLYFQGLPRGSLTALDQLCHHSLRAGHSYFLSSLKLQGDSDSGTLPKFVALFKDLIDISISTTVSMTQDLLKVLGEMRILLYLKMTARSIDENRFIIQDGKFMSLKRLCLVLRVVGRSVLTIEDGGGRNISSLQLICKDLVGLSGVEIRHLPDLNEIFLHQDVDDETRQAWEAEARNHHNMPYVSYIKVDQIREEPSAVEEEPTHEDHMEVEPEGSFPDSVGLHFNGAPEDCDKEALVLAAVQPQKVKNRKLAQVQPRNDKKRKLAQVQPRKDKNRKLTQLLISPNAQDEAIEDTNMEDATDNLAASIRDIVIDDEGSA